MATKAHPGFTLIELLVVIAIIALLVSILLPSLTQAKELARQAVCMTNQHHIGSAVATYANEYDGFIPPWWSHDDHVRSPWSTYAAYWEGGWPVKGSKRASFTLSPLEFERFVPTGKMFYCPSQTYQGHQWEFFRYQWEELTHQQRLSRAVYIRMGYMYNPYTTSPNNWSGYMVYKTLDEYPPGRIMLLDILIDQVRTAHATTPGWIVAFSDSHAEMKADADAYDSLPIEDGDALGSNWNVLGSYLADLEAR